LVKKKKSLPLELPQAAKNFKKLQKAYSVLSPYPHRTHTARLLTRISESEHVLGCRHRRGTGWKSTYI
jgi:hypothetical protein